MKANLNLFSKFMLSMAAILTAVGCAKESSFSLLDESELFKQSSSTANSKVDILWVIDNSGSMESSQSNVINNLNSFISDFASKNLDFKMAVTTSDAYRTIFNGKSACSRFRDGILNSSCNTISGKTYSGIRVIDSLTPNIAGTFMINASQTDSVNGIYGSGDERVFQSLKTALNNNENAGFIRSDSFFSVIFVSDEEDFSWDGSTINESYTNPGLHTVQSYVDYLDQMTGSTPTSRRYNVNAMAIFDTTCRDFLNTSFAGRKVAQRLGEMVDKVNGAFSVPESRGLKTSLCGNFSDDLKKIAANTLTLASRFTLGRIPIPSTIVVRVDGVLVPEQNANPLADGGWVFDSATNSILFIGMKYIPHAGANISVDYDPVAYGQ